MVCKARIKLKDYVEHKVFINEDLTLAKSNLAYQARTAVKNGLYHNTWTIDGEVFVKKTATSPSRKINRPSDLEKDANGNIAKAADAGSSPQGSEYVF